MDQITNTNRKRPPTHPGAILREDVLPALKLTVTEAAQKLGVSRVTLHRVLGEHAAVSPEMAVRLGKFCGNGPNLWMNLQQAYDLWHAERALANVVRKIPRVEAQAAGDQPIVLSGFGRNGMAWAKGAYIKAVGAPKPRASRHAMAKVAARKR